MTDSEILLACIATAIIVAIYGILVGFSLGRWG